MDDVTIPLETADQVWKMLVKMMHIAHKLGGEFDEAETKAFNELSEAVRDAKKAIARQRVAHAPLP